MFNSLIYVCYWQLIAIHVIEIFNQKGARLPQDVVDVSQVPTDPLLK